MPAAKATANAYAKVPQVQASTDPTFLFVEQPEKTGDEPDREQQSDERRR